MRIARALVPLAAWATTNGVTYKVTDGRDLSALGNPATGLGSPNVAVGPFNLYPSSDSAQKEGTLFTTVPYCPPCNDATLPVDVTNPQCILQVDVKSRQYPNITSLCVEGEQGAAVIACTNTQSTLRPDGTLELSDGNGDMDCTVGSPPENWTPPSYPVVYANPGVNGIAAGYAPAPQSSNATQTQWRQPSTATPNQWTRPNKSDGWALRPHGVFTIPSTLKSAAYAAYEFVNSMNVPEHVRSRPLSRV